MTPREQAEKIVDTWLPTVAESRSTHGIRMEARRDLIDAIASALTVEREKAERLREAASELVKVTSGNHNAHWDRTMRGGAGCEQCLAELKARENVRTALKETQT